MRTQYQIRLLDDDRIEVRNEGNTFEPTVIKELNLSNPFYNTMDAILNMYTNINFDPIINTLWDKIESD